MSLKSKYTVVIFNKSGTHGSQTCYLKWTNAEVVLTAKKVSLSLSPSIQGILRHYNFGIYIPISDNSYRMTFHFHYSLLLMAEISLFSNNKHHVVSVHSIKFLLVPMPAHKCHF